LKSTGQSERLIQAELEREKQQQSAKKVKPVSTSVKESEDEVAKKPVYAAMKLRSTGNADAIKAGGDVGKEVYPDEGKLASVQLKSTGQSERLIQAELEREKQQQSAEKVKPVSQASKHCVKESEDEVAKKPVYAAMKLRSTGIADAIKAGGDVGKEVHPDEGKLASVQLKSTGQSERLIQAELEREKQQQSAKKVKPVSTCVKESEDEVAKKPVYAAMKLRSTGNADAIKAGGYVGKEVHPDEGKLASVQLKSTGQSERLIQAELEREKQQQSAKKVKPVSTCVKESEDEVAKKPVYAAMKLRSTGNADAIKAGGDAGKEVHPDEGKLASVSVEEDRTI
jgi:hypothetical protein